MRTFSSKRFTTLHLPTQYPVDGRVYPAEQIQLYVFWAIIIPSHVEFAEQFFVSLQDPVLGNMKMNNVHVTSKYAFKNFDPKLKI